MRSILMILAAVAVSGLAQDVAAEKTEKPNIILVITDDQGYPPVGRLGHPWIRTPNLDTLHDSSSRFTRFLVDPTCSPTRSAIMTGRYPLKNGITHTVLERERLTLNATILPQGLKTAGYTSGIFGKWHLGDEEAYQPRNRGFDEEFIHGAGGIGQAYDCSCADAPGNKYNNPVVRHNGTFKKTNGFCTDVFFSAALDWIHAQTEEKRPFFAYIATNAPHGPYIAPEKNAARFQKLGFGKEQAGFYGMIENIDENVGRLMGKLEEWKLLGNTVVIFMSDNGMTPGGSGKLDKPLAEGYPLHNAGMKGLKGTPDEGGVRVPFFIRWDGRIPAGLDIDRIAAHIDILPTLAALAGAETPAGQIEGRDLMPLLAGEGKQSWPDRFFFTHVARWPVGANPDDFQWKNFAVRNQRFRLVGRDQLYDMDKDPGQTTNVAGEHPEVVTSMLDAYQAFWKEARPLMINEGVPISKTRPYHVDYRRQEQEGGIPEWRPRVP
jgi:arylsulfatase A-like enzyme